MKLKFTFNTNPDGYSKFRPSYPKEISKRIIENCNLSNISSILEIGPGTGQATKDFIHLNCNMVLVELAQNFTKKLTEDYKKNKNISVVRSSFEKYKTDKKFDLIFSAQAFHWIDSKIQFTKTYDLLKDLGHLAIFEHKHIQNGAFFKDVQICYDKFYYPNHKKQVEKAMGKITCNTGKFNLVEDYNIEWSIKYKAEEYIGLINTFSDHIALPKESKENLYNSIFDLINCKYNGSIEKFNKTNLKIYKKIT